MHLMAQLLSIRVIGGVLLMLPFAIKYPCIEALGLQHLYRYSRLFRAMKTRCPFLSCENNNANTD